MIRSLVILVVAMLLLGLLALGCVPTGSPPKSGQGVYFAASPANTRGPAGPDVSGTAAAIALQNSIVQATDRAGAIQATQEAQAAGTAAVSTQRAWEVAGWTATAAGWTATNAAKTEIAGIANTTATAQARNTATAQAAPAVTATQGALSRAVLQDKQAAILQATWAPWIAGIDFGFRLILMATVLGVIIWAGYKLIPAYAFLLRSKTGVVELAPAMGRASVPARTSEPTTLAVYRTNPSEYGMSKTKLPCSAAEMDILAYWAVVRGDRSLAINRWEDRGQSGKIDEIRTWAVKAGYADEDPKTKAVRWNDSGVEVLDLWRQQRPYPIRPV